MRSRVKNIFWLLSMVLAIVLSGCASEIVTIYQTQSTISILASSQATEGIPGNQYSYSAFTFNPPLKPYYEWIIDDSIVATRSPNQQLTIVFPTNGWYFLRVNLYDAESNRLAATSLIRINIRSTYPLLSLVRVQSGSFFMGSDKNFYEQPVRRVTISKQLEVGTYEVMQHQWRELMGYNPSWFKGDSLPVESITWNDAVDFCNRLSIRSGLTPCYMIADVGISCNFNANGYRLPTEAEWEYLSRGGTTTDSYGGDYQVSNDGCTPPDPTLDPLAWYCANANQTTQRVGQKKPNAFGLYDVIGNVSEWCWDYFQDSYYMKGQNIDPIGPSFGTERMLRGGSFINNLFTLRIANRGLQLPLYASYTMGFRIVRTMP